MRSYIPSFDLRVPDTLAEVLELFAEGPGTWQPFAGGTDLMVLLEAGRLEHKNYVSVSTLRELRTIDVTDGGVSVGAASTFTEILRHPVLAAEFPMLCAAAAETGGVANQNRGTLGGNIANASPAADSPPALLAYDAELEIVSRRGSRRLPYERFHTGYKKVDLAPDELIRAIFLPRRTRPRRQVYRKIGTRRAQAISKVCFAGAIEVEGGIVTDARVAFGSVAPTVVRARRAEDALRGKPLDRETVAAARDAVAADISPIDDIRSTARYRAWVAANLLEDLLAAGG